MSKKKHKHNKINENVQKPEVESPVAEVKPEEMTPVPVVEVKPDEPAATVEEMKPSEQEPVVAVEEVKADEPVPTAESVSEDSSPGKKSRIWIIPCAVFAVVILVIGATYGFGVHQYKTTFLKGTVINGVDCSDLSRETVCAILDEQISGYVLEVNGRNPQKPEEKTVIGTISPADISMHRKDTQKQVDDIFAKQNPFKWYEMLWKEGQNFELGTEVEFEEENLRRHIDSWEACCSEILVKPGNACISEYIAEENAYCVLPETPGSQMDESKMIPALTEALYALNDSIDIEDTDCYSTAKITVDDRKLNEVVDTVNQWLSTKISYNWYGNEITIDGRQLKDWVSVEDGVPTLDEEAIAEYIQELAATYDPNGNVFTFETTLGEKLELKCKSGWKTDCEKEIPEIIECIRSGVSLEREPVSSTKNYVQFAQGVGDSYAEIDLTNQHMYFYYQGEMVLETDFVSGDLATGHRTPEGIYAITYKTRDKILRGPGYASFVYYWMPFYGGYGMHDATWRSVFGGKIYQNNGSHGCINLPLGMAEKVYGYVQTGFPVVCYYYPEGMNPKDKEPEAEEEEELIEENPIQGQW